METNITVVFRMLCSPAHAIVTPGEAPETDDELDDAKGTQSQSVAGKSPMPFLESSKLNRNFDIRAKPIYDDILHRKLRDANIQMDNDLRELICKEGSCASKDMLNLASAANNTRETLQDSWVNIRKVADNLYKVYSKLESIIASVHVWSISSK